MHALTWTSVSSKVTMLWAILVPVLLPNVSIAQCNWKAWKEAANETVWVAFFCFPQYRYWRFRCTSLVPRPSVRYTHGSCWGSGNETTKAPATSHINLFYLDGTLEMRSDYIILFHAPNWLKYWNFFASWKYQQWTPCLGPFLETFSGECI